MNGSRLGAIDRRTLIRSGALASLLAVSGVGAGAAPKLGGTLRVAVPGPGKRLCCPHTGLLPYLAHRTVYEGLTDIAPDGTLQGALAVSWQSSRDGRTWEFQLRDGCAFHDGSAIGEEDILASLRGTQDIRTDRVRLGPDGVLTVRTRWTRRDLPLLFARPEAVIRPSDTSRDGIGTGRYGVVAFEPEARVLLERAGTDGWVDRIELLTLNSPEARLEALLAGRVDVADHLPAAAEARISRHRHATVHVATASRTIYLGGPDPRVSRALAAQLGTRMSPEGANGWRGVASTSIPNAPDALRAQVRLAPHPTLRDGLLAEDVMRQVIRSVRALGVEVTADAEAPAVVIGIGPRRSLPEHVHPIAHIDSLIGVSARLAHDTPPDVTRLGERWFFT